MSHINDPVPGVTLEEFNDALKENPCPKCSQTGGLSVAWKFVASPLGSYSLTGAQMKLSAKRVLIATCSLCGARARAHPTKMPLN